MYDPIYGKDTRWIASIPTCALSSATSGYNCYYLNAQAGPTRAWLVNDDPAHTWIKNRL